MTNRQLVVHGLDPRYRKLEMLIPENGNGEYPKISISVTCQQIPQKWWQIPLMREVAGSHALGLLGSVFLKTIPAN